MGLQNFILIGPQEIIEMLIRFLLQMEFYLTMSHPEGERILFREKQF